VPADPVKGDVAAGVVELPVGSAQFPNGELVIARLGNNMPEVQCQVTYADRAQAQAVFSAADFDQLGWSEQGGYRQIELRLQTVPDVAKAVLSLRSLIILAPVLAAFLALCPVLIWPAPDNSASRAQIAAAEQRAADLTSAPDISRHLRQQIVDLHEQIRAVENRDAATASQQSDNARATDANAIVVFLLAIVVAAPSFGEVVRWRRRKTG
jgi:hypothetical protein